MRKLAMIRKDDEDPCPFGLTIPMGCSFSGDIVDKMAPIDTLKDVSDEEKEQIRKANVHLFNWTAPCTRCKYAAKLMPGKKAVECSYRDTAPGDKEGEVLLGSPLYSKVFEGVGLDGATSFPLSYYENNSTSRNAYYGLTSLCGKDMELMKLANEAIKELDNFKSMHNKP